MQEKLMKKTKANVTEMTSTLITDNRLGNFLRYMPNPDEIAAGTKESYETYRQMKQDPRIKSLLSKIKTIALAFPTTFKQPEGCPDDVYDFIKSIPLFDNMYKKNKRALSSLDYGFSVTEVIWEDPAENNGKWIPKNLITRKPERFSFDPDWNLYNMSGIMRVPLNQNYKWLIFQHDPDDENPYGNSVLRCVYWAWMFKRAGFEFWLQATEKFSVKSIIALFKSEGDEEKLQKRATSIAEMLLGIESGSASAVGNIETIHELSMAGSLNDFRTLIDACDLQISYGLTGQSIATSKTDGGSLALGEVQAEMLYEDCKGIALEIQGVIQKLVNWIVELNFNEDVVPPNFVFDIDRKASFEQIMKAIEVGIPVSKKSLYDEYHLPRPANEDDSFVMENPMQIMASDMSVAKHSDGNNTVKKNFQFF